MDPFTQRMLERARARKGNMGHSSNEESTRRSPLQETSNLSEQKLKVTAEVEFMLNGPCNVENIKGISVSPTRPHIVSVESKGKENCKTPENEGHAVVAIRDTAKMRLRRLGALYSEEEANISSPIHRTEETFTAEEEEDMKPVKSTTRLNRLAALANTINEWEDDLSHPQLTNSSEKKTERKISGLEKTSHIINSYTDQKLQIKPLNAIQKNKLVDRKGSDANIVWDKAILETLEAQGFERTVSNSRLVYDFSKHSSQDGKSTSMKPATKASAVLSDIKEKQEPSEISPKKSVSVTNAKVTRSPVMGVSQLCNSAKVISPREKPSMFWKQGHSPQKVEVSKIELKSVSNHAQMSPKKGSVLHKAAVFESGSPEKQLTKDPIELSVAERLALFEKNKGQALIPKTAFSMAVPTKYLNKTQQDSITSKKFSPEKSSSATQWTRLGNFGIVQKPVEQPKLSPIKNDIPQNKVLASKQLFETGAINGKGSSVPQNVPSERQKELEMLQNRWNRNKQIGSVVLDSRFIPNDAQSNSNLERQHVSVPPTPPPLPQLSPTKKNSVSEMQQKLPTPSDCINKDDMKKQYPVLADVRRFKVGDPKPGRLYPCLSDIETCTETESEMPDTDGFESSGSNDSCSNLEDTSFGREILQAAGINKSPVKEESESDLSQSETDALKEIDDFLDEALGDSSDSEGPTPPKRTREHSLSPQKLMQTVKSNSPSKHRTPEKDYSPTSTHCQSFRYNRGHFERMDEESCLPDHVVDGDQQLPLMHTVSFYRRQQNMGVKTTPVRQIIRRPEVRSTVSYNSEESISFPADDRNTVRSKISTLLDEVTKQQTVISQASQALNLCCATVEFSGSAEQVEGERLLLLATHRRQAALHEIQRLEVEGTLRPGGSTASVIQPSEQGTLIVTNIVLPVKKEYIHNIGTGNTCHHFMCLLRSQEQVLGTPVLAASPTALKGTPGLMWKGPLKLNGLYTDFKATLEVYSLETQKEILPHNVKYHITDGSSGKKEGNKLRLTPKKVKQESRLIMPTVQSPAGPSAVRTSSFQLAGYVVFSLKEVHRTQFTLNKVGHKSPLEGNVLVQLSSELSLTVTERGFLTMFEDISGFGAWHRRWCLLKGATLCYWKYPDDEGKKEPIGWIDLKACSTESVGLVSRDICARPNTFLLETTRPPQPDDVESLILVRSKNRTTIRHLLSADTKEDRLVWCSQLNKTLSMLRAWNSDRK
ncbi:anillin-like isoform X1 [Schistocerca serialis cubense]|uniref:anillin-like isoform X1 n=1 Tax=Schistocerca serialis cubense TaxID=2023355 RepID=UPI00214E04B1|nr:anillin-like isoform X1 [Schistocerca serialis cubense]